ncbi:MAG: hypothetical protein KOO62_12010 [candidate division Zixibacteria bacterium]|nr:hypothetical protein [candidate division Zixibacteria bacterium]
MSTIVGLIILVMLLVAVAVLLLRLRLRLQWGSERKSFFVGLGRSGPEFDFSNKTGVFRLLGITLKRFPLDSDRKEDISKKKAKTTKVPKPRRQWSWAQLRYLVPVIVQEAGSFMRQTLSSLVIEELEGEVRAGFDSPSDTGMAYGYYQAALAAVPGVVGRVRFVPIWDGPSFSGSAAVTVALPLYKLFWRMIVLAWRLPLREIYKLAIGTRKGGHDVQ